MHRAPVRPVPPTPGPCFAAPARLPAPATGGGLHDSHVVKGMVLKRGPEGAVQKVADAKVAVFAQGVDTSSTETKVRQGGAQCWCTRRRCAA